MDIRKKFFTVKVVRHWNRFSGEAVAAPPLEVFKARLERLGATWSGGRCLCSRGRVELDGF